MINIEVIGLDPPCKKCTELLENANKAIQQTGIEANVEKKWTLSVWSITGTYLEMTFPGKC